MTVRLSGLAAALALLLASACSDPNADRGAALQRNLASDRRIYVTRGSIEPDKLASTWLLTRHVDPGAEVHLLEAGVALPDEPGYVAFDCAEARWARTRLRSTFGVILDELQVDDPALQEIARLIDEAELQYWRMDADSAAGALDERLKALILADDHEAAIAYLDAVYARGGAPIVARPKPE